MEKFCSTCKCTKMLSEFSKRAGTKDGLSYSCKQCASNRSRSHYDRHKPEYVKRASTQSTARCVALQNWRRTLKCEGCDESDPVCMDFHHVNSDTKEANVATLTAFSLGKMLTELKKCVYVCATCHRKIHAYGMNKIFTHEPVDLATSFSEYVKNIAV